MTNTDAPAAHSGSMVAAAEPLPPGRTDYSHAHVASLDGIRGAAILLVLLYHFSSSLNVFGITNPVLGALRIGWCGVDVFFALSGFLITGILLDTKGHANYFRNFYARRVLRIFPLYYGSLFVVFLLRLALPDAGVWGSHDGMLAPGSLLWPVLYLQNLAIVLQGSSVTGVTTHYWSLAVEEHFYLLWPLLVWLATRRQLMRIAIAAVLVSMAGRVMLWRYHLDLDAAFGLTPLRLDGLAIGALAALAIRAPEGLAVIVRRAWMVLAVAAPLLVGLLVLRHTTQQTDPAVWLFAYPLVATVTATGLVVSMVRGPVARVMSLAPLRWLGKYSFGLYVWHPIIGMLLLHSKFSIVSAGTSPGIVIMSLLGVQVLDLVVAWLSYQLWEKRFLDLKRLFSGGTAKPLRPAPVISQESDTGHVAPVPGQ